MKLQNWINPKYLEEKKQKELKIEFQNNSNFSHLSIEDFFIEEKLINIKNALEQEEYYKENSDLYQFKRTEDFKKTINKTLQELRIFLLTKEFIELIENITNLKLKSNNISLHSLKLENTDYLLCHDDLIENRKLAFIINFSNLTIKDGGELELLKINKDDSAEIFKKINPKFNLFNIFEVSNKSYHQVNEMISNKNRVTIGGWYYE